MHMYIVHDYPKSETLAVTLCNDGIRERINGKHVPTEVEAERNLDLSFIEDWDGIVAVGQYVLNAVMGLELPEIVDFVFSESRICETMDTFFIQTKLIQVFQWLTRKFKQNPVVTVDSQYMTFDMSKVKKLKVRFTIGCFFSNVKQIAKIINNTSQQIFFHDSHFYATFPFLKFLKTGVARMYAIGGNFDNYRKGVLHNMLMESKQLSSQIEFFGLEIVDLNKASKKKRDLFFRLANWCEYLERNTIHVLDEESNNIFYMLAKLKNIDSYTNLSSVSQMTQSIKVNYLDLTQGLNETTTKSSIVDQVVDNVKKGDMQSANNLLKSVNTVTSSQ
jgi:hypothetical protein